VKRWNDRTQWSDFLFSSIQRGRYSNNYVLFISVIITADIRHPLKDPLILVIIRADQEFFPIAVHPAVQEEAVERFETEELSCGDEAGYQDPYFSGQGSEVCHRRKTFLYTNKQSKFGPQVSCGPYYICIGRPLAVYEKSRSKEVRKSVKGVLHNVLPVLELDCNIGNEGNAIFKLGIGWQTPQDLDRHATWLKFICSHGRRIGTMRNTNTGPEEEITVKENGENYRQKILNKIRLMI